MGSVSARDRPGGLGELEGLAWLWGGVAVGRREEVP